MTTVILNASFSHSGKNTYGLIKIILTISNKNSASSGLRYNFLSFIWPKYCQQLPTLWVTSASCRSSLHSARFKVPLENKDNSF